MSLLEDAIRVAVDAHARQYDKSGVPYIFHPLAVADIVRQFGGDDAAVAIAILHDVLEDSEKLNTVDDLLKALGFIDYHGLALKLRAGQISRHGIEALDVANGVQALTKVKGQDRREYIEQVAADERTKLVKWADITHNWVRLPFITDLAVHDRLVAKYTADLAVLGETEEQQAYRHSLEAAYAWARPVMTP